MTKKGRRGISSRDTALDQMNTIGGNRLGNPMRAACADLTVTNLPGAHWLPLECKPELIRAIRTWLRDKGL